MKKIISFIFFLTIPFIFVGCGLGSAGIVSPVITGYATWKSGEASKYYESSHTRIYNAVKRNCEKLQYKISKEKKLKNDCDYIVAEGENHTFKITIVPVQPNITQVKIRIDFMGDKPYAELFYKKLDEQLNIIWFDNKN